MVVLYPTESTAAGLRLADPGFSGPPPGCLHTNKAASKSGEEGEVYAEYKQECRRRIFVLTPGGEVLQKFMLVEKGMRIMRIFLCGSEILCTYIKTGLIVAAPDEPFRVVALTGL